MSKIFVRVLVVTSLLLIGGVVGFTVSAADVSTSEEGESSYIERLHRHLMALHGKGGGHGGHADHGDAMAHGMGGMHHMMHQLDLDDAQRDRLHAIHHTLLTSFHGEHVDAKGHIETLIEGIETGTLDVTETTIMLERHVDSLRAALGTVAAETVALLNNLDGAQRATVVAHLEALAHHHE